MEKKKTVFSFVPILVLTLTISISCFCLVNDSFLIHGNLDDSHLMSYASAEIMVAAAQSPNSTASPTPSPSPNATQRPSPTPSPTPSHSPTPSPSPSPTSTPTPSPTPSTPSTTPTPTSSANQTPSVPNPNTKSPNSQYGIDAYYWTAFVAAVITVFVVAATLNIKRKQKNDAAHYPY